jgi:sortase (surface protein transpeptidase)
VASIIIGFFLFTVALSFFKKVDSVKEAKDNYISGRRASGEVSKRERRKAEAFWERERRKRKQEDDDDGVPY